jgi:hypothetical protein
MVDANIRLSIPLNEINTDSRKKKKQKLVGWLVYGV